MRPKHRFPRPLLVLLAASILAAGCSGGETDEATDTTTDATVSVEPGAGAVAPEDEAFCDAYVAFFLSGQEFPGAFEPEPADDAAFLQQSRALYTSGADHLASAEAAAPPEIADEVATMADAWSTAAEQATAATTADEVPRHFLETPELQAASATVGDHARAHCDMANAIAAPDA